MQDGTVATVWRVHAPLASLEQFRVLFLPLSDYLYPNDNKTTPMDNEKQNKLQIKDLMNKDKSRYAKPAFHKINTVDNLFSVFFGFQSGLLLVEGQ